MQSTISRTLEAICRQFCCSSATESGNGRISMSRTWCWSTVCWCPSSSSLESLWFNRWIIREFCSSSRMSTSCYLQRNSNWHFRDNWKYWLFTLATGTMLLLIVAIVWFMKIWIIWSPINEEDPNRIVLPKSRTLRFLYRVSKNIMRNAIVRLALYILTVGALVSSALIHLFECERIDQEIPTNDDKAEITIHSATCSNAWASENWCKRRKSKENLTYFSHHCRQSLRVWFWPSAVVSCSCESIFC